MLWTDDDVGWLVAADTLIEVVLLLLDFWDVRMSYWNRALRVLVAEPDCAAVDRDAFLLFFVERNTA